MFRERTIHSLLALIAVAASSTACTRAVTGYFTPSTLSQTEPPPPPPPVSEDFQLGLSTTRTVERYRDVDLLWMIDNSGSMANHQDALTTGFNDFATTYFNKDRNIRLATIPTDTFLAGLTNAPQYGPGQGKCYSYLLPGIHDGIRPPFASLNGDCSLNGVLPAGRTGKPILETKNSNGTPVNLPQLISEFRVNAKVGTSGSGSERGLQSILKLLQDNEGQAACATTGEGCLFRKNKLRGIIMVADEHSQDILSDGVTTIDHTEATYRSKDDDAINAEAALMADIFRRKVNTFFSTLDGTADPNYFVVTIANLTCADTGDSYCGLRNRNGSQLRSPNERWGPEYLAVHDAVKADASNTAGALSISANINTADFKAVLAQVGQTLETQTEQVIITSFTLSRDPSSVAPVRAEVHDQGAVTQVNQGAIRVSGRNVDIDRAGLPANWTPDARLVITFVPL